jgi:hypothetical protein
MTDINLFSFKYLKEKAEKEGKSIEEVIDQIAVNIQENVNKALGSGKEETETIEPETEKKEGFSKK